MRLCEDKPQSISSVGQKCCHNFQRGRTETPRAFSRLCEVKAQPAGLEKVPSALRWCGGIHVIPRPPLACQRINPDSL